MYIYMYKKETQKKEMRRFRIIQVDEFPLKLKNAGSSRKFLISQWTCMIFLFSLLFPSRKTLLLFISHFRGSVQGPLLQRISTRDAFE